MDVGFVACAMVLYHEVVLGPARVIGRDALHYLVPIGASLREAYLGTGSLWWDSNLNHGLPLAARWSPMAFYPGQWLNALFEPITALSVGILIHLVLAAAGAMRLSLRYTRSVPAAWVAGFSYAFGGYLISVTVGGGYLFGAALLPLSLVCLHRLAERPSLWRAGQLAWVFTLQILVADPQTLYYEALFVAPWVIFFHPGKSGTPLRRGALAAVAGLLAVAAGTCQWLPAAEFSTFSVRSSGGIVDQLNGEWAFHPLRVVQFFSPHVFGSVTPQKTFWPRSLLNSGKFELPWAPLLYNGLLIWAGLPLIKRTRWSRPLVAIALLSFVFLVLAFGEWGPLYQVALAVLPGARFFRYPEKFLVFFTLGLCVLGSVGLERLLEAFASDAAEARRGRRRVVVGVGGLALLAVAGRAWLDPSSETTLAWFTAVVEGQRAESVVPEVALRLIASSLEHTALVCILIALLSVVGRRLRPALLALLIALVAIADVLPASLPQRYVADSTLYREIPAYCGRVPEPRVGLRPLVWRYEPPELMLEVPTEDQGSRFETEHIRGWETLQPNTGAQYCIRQVDGYEAARMRTYQILWKALEAQPERRLRIFGVQNIVASVQGSIDPSVFPVLPGSDEYGFEVHQVRDPLPYAHPTGRAEYLGDADAAVRRVADPSFDFAESIVLEGPLRIADFPEAVRRATLRSHRPGEIVVDVDFAAAGYLMLEETHYPGWRAETELGALRVQRTNGHFIGVEVPAGARAVRFVFDPPTQRLGNLVSASAITLLLLSHLAAAVLRRRPRSFGSPQPT